MKFKLPHQQMLYWQGSFFKEINGKMMREKNFKMYYGVGKNFYSIHWNHNLMGFISWDYPFTVDFVMKYPETMCLMLQLSEKQQH